MGTSKTYKESVRWGEQNDNKGPEPPVSPGTAVKAEGTHMSGSSETSHRPMGLKKTRTSRSTAKAPVPSGYS